VSVKFVVLISRFIYLVQEIKSVSLKKIISQIVSDDQYLAYSGHG